MALDITEIKIRDKVTIAGTEITSVETTLTGGNSALPRADAVKAYVDNLFNANDAMQFKGTIGTGGTVTALPTTHSAGWTYRVITAATYAGVVTEVGDLIIAVIDRAGTGNANSDWTVVQTNIDGAVVGPASAVSANVARFNGTSGKLIQDSGVAFETTLTTNSDAKSPTSKAVATYVTGLGYTTNTGTVTGVTGTAPIASSGGTAPAISITAASQSAAGSMSSADKTKLDGIATGATANSTDATLLARGNHTGTQTAATISDFATAVAATASVTANTAKVTNATHTGDVTGATALTIANDAVTFAKMQNIDSARILGRVTAAPGNTEALTAAQVRTLLNVADGATANTGTVTSVSAGTQISGMAMTITNGTTTPSIATSISNAANFRTAIGAGTGNGTVTAVTGTAPIVSSGGTAPAISISAATTSAAGSMSAADKTKLDGIASGATANTGTVTSVGGTGTVAGLTLSGTVTTSGNLTLGGTLSTPISTINDSTTVGQNLVKLANPSAIRFIRINANNTVTALSDSAFRTAIGAGTSSTTGTVTSVATGSGLTGGTITTSGTLSVDSTVVRTTGAQSISGVKTLGNSFTGTSGTSTIITSEVIAGALPSAPLLATGLSVTATGNSVDFHGATGIIAKAVGGSSNDAIVAYGLDGVYIAASDSSAGKSLRLKGVGGTSAQTTLQTNSATSSSITVTLPSSTGTLTLNGHTHTVANITDIASNYVNLAGTQTIIGSKTLNSTLSMAYNAGIAKSYGVYFSSGATYGGPSIRGNTSGELERSYYTSSATIFDIGNSTAWDTLRYRGDAVSLTSTGGSGTTGGSINAGATLAQGDTIMMEVSNSSVVSTGNEVAVVIFTLGAADTTPTSLTQGIVYRTSWSSSLIFYHYTFKVSHSGSTLYFDDSFRITFTDTSTASNILAQTSVTLHVGRIWRLYNQL
jgi:hypothetical protein